jgi:hypothetical protein
MTSGDVQNSGSQLFVWLGQGVFVFVRSSDCGVRAPEAEMILGRDAGNPSVSHSEVHQGQNTSGFPNVSVLLLEYSAGNAIPDGKIFEPEKCNLGLVGCPR